MVMNQVAIGTLAALGGSAIGAMAPLFANYILQRSQTQRDLLNRQLAQRETLYSDFIKEASRLYADSMIHALEQMNDIVALYALVSRIRLMASESVVRSAEEFVRIIVQHYGDPNITVDQLRETALEAKADPLNKFSLACRRELQVILLSGSLPATIRNRLAADS